MQHILLVLSLMGIFASSANAQTTTIVDLRTGVQPKATYHYAEVFQVRGRWIVPDVGYIDFADAKQYREWFVGAGYNVWVTKRVTITNELYFVLTDGFLSGNTKYIQPWTGIFYTLTPRLGGETVIFPYIPLNDSSRKQWVVERAKLEYALTSLFKVGAGYGAYQFGDSEWQHKPFITGTITPFSGRYGRLEFWYQRLSGDKTQMQVRYKLVHSGK